MEALIESFTTYYGLDWLALLTGLTGTYLITNLNRWGFFISMIGCVSGFSVALISGQFGFIAYNLILVGLMMRGFFSWGVQEQAAYSYEAAE